MGGQSFEDLQCWQVARELCREVYARTGSGSCKNDYGFVDQIRRASVSVMNNVAEGYERGSNKDFIKFLYIARASAGEVRSMTYIALDQDYFPAQECDHIQSLCRRASALCWSLIKARSKHLGLASKLQIALFLALIPVMRMVSG